MCTGNQVRSELGASAKYVLSVFLVAFIAGCSGGVDNAAGVSSGEENDASNNQVSVPTASTDLESNLFVAQALPELGSAVAPVVEPAPEPEVQPTPEPAPEPEVQPTPEPAPEPEAQPVPEPEAEQPAEENQNTNLTPATQSIYLAWAPASSEDVGYNIYYSRNGSEYSFAGYYDSAESNEVLLSSSDDLSLSENDMVCFVISAVSADGESATSEASCTSVI